jgi:hypothetical protein
MRNILCVALFFHLCSTLLSAQPLSYDPFYVLPSQKGYKSIDLGMDNGDTGQLTDATNFIFMSKFTPGDKVEVGAQFTFGFLNDFASNFASLTVGGKYSLGENRAAILSLALPAGDIDDPGISLGIMNTFIASEKFRINKRLTLGVLDGYTRGTGMVVDALIEPAFLLSPQWTGYLDFQIASNTDDWGDLLAIDFAPNIDWIMSDGNALNFGLKLGLSGNRKRSETGIAITLLRNM